MTPAAIAVLVSCGSLCIACLSLGWNIYRDIELKPKVHTTYRLMRVAGGMMHGQDIIIVCATNHGPGETKLTMLVYDATSVRHRLLRRRSQGIIMQDESNRQSWHVPCRVRVGDEAQFLLPVNEHTRWAETVSRVGVLDSFGKIHWCSRKDARAVRRKVSDAFRRSLEN